MPKNFISHAVLFLNATLAFTLATAQANDEKASQIRYTVLTDHLHESGDLGFFYNVDREDVTNADQTLRKTFEQRCGGHLGASAIIGSLEPNWLTGVAYCFNQPPNTALPNHRILTEIADTRALSPQREIDFKAHNAKQIAEATKKLARKCAQGKGVLGAAKGFVRARYLQNGGIPQNLKFGVVVAPCFYP